MQQITLAHYDSHLRYLYGLSDHVTDEVAYNNNEWWSYELYIYGSHNLFIYELQYIMTYM
jgi:hypothetical protein